MDAAEITKGLISDGYHLCSSLPNVQDAVTYALCTSPSTKVRNKVFFKRLGVFVDETNAITQLVKHPTIVAGVAGYLKDDPLISSVDIYTSRHITDYLHSSQRYHRDRDAAPQVKLFINCSDVVLENGPVTWISANDSDKLQTSVNIPAEKRLSADFDPGCEELQLVGPPGSACFLDTSKCYHYGSRVKRGAIPRVVIVAQYVRRDYQRLLQYAK